MTINILLIGADYMKIIKKIVKFPFKISKYFIKGILDGLSDL
jgi:hypothetical protein